MLRVQHLTKRYPGAKALDEVCFDLVAGEIHALCGENGAGKSTLIKVLSGELPFGSFEGSFQVAGKEARFGSVRDASAAGISAIPQELACIDQLTIAENICLGREPRKWGMWLDRRAAERRAAHMLEKFGLEFEPGTPMRSLGIGQKQLVEIVKALSRDSRILILDEPTAALAGHEVTVLLRLLRDLRARGVACVYVSHRLEEVFEIADRVTVLRDGRTVCTLAADQIDEPTVVRSMVGREIGELYPSRAQTRGETILRVDGLAVADDRGLPRLRDLSFELRAGEVLGIGGLMGAGRTELLMHLYGAAGRRTAGRVVLDGRELSGGDPRAVLRAGMALVSEDRRRYGIVAPESVGFNLSLSSIGSFARAGVVGRRSEEVANRRWFDAMGIRAGGLNAIAGRLSGGNQQKVVLGRALMTQPRVMLLDEPTRGIDIGAKLEIYALINRLAADGCGVILVSSELPELIGLSDRILMLHDGAVGGRFERIGATPESLMRAALGMRSTGGLTRTSMVR